MSEQAIDMIKAAFREGQLARESGAEVDANPYSLYWLSESWRAGWHDQPVPTGHTDKADG